MLAPLNIMWICARRARFVLPALLTLVLTAPPAIASAQSPSDGAPRVGTRVRVATVYPDSAIESRRAIGVVQSLTGDNVTVAWDNGLRSTLPSAAISRMDTSLGPRPYVLRGMGFGLLGGAVAGGVIGALSYEQSAFLDFGIGVEILANSIVFGAVGTVLGGVIGAAGRREGWSPLRRGCATERLSVEPVIGARSHGVRVELRL